MKINSIKIKNFRSYKGLTTFDFRFQEGKNIILIGGENGAGKSSIFEAMRICLYGPLTYKYQGMVANYISRIKSMINEDAYSDKSVGAFIELDINMTNNTIEENYIVRRQWSFDNSRLIEDFIVIENGEELDKEETNNFYEYFKSIIPPAVFELSFFDGEKLFDFFEDRISGQKLKETMLTLNNFDIFNILSRELELNTRRKNRERKNLKDEILELEAIEDNISNKRQEYDQIKVEIQELEKQIEDLLMDINVKNNEFISSGGLNQEVRDRLVHEISKFESDRDKINLEIKSFSNDILPFIIVSKEIAELKEQLYDEQEFIVYEAIKDRVDIKSIKANLKSKNLYPENLDVLINEITKFIIPREFNQGFKPIHYLSKEQSNKVISNVNEISELKIEQIDYFEEIQKLTKNIADNKKKLRSSMDMNEEKRYVKLIEDMNMELNNKYIILEGLKSDKETLDKEIEIERKKLLKINEKIDLIKKADNIKDMSDVIIEMTEVLLKEITSAKRLDISESFNQIFNLIIRKDRFIDYIDIDETFEVVLYVKKSFSVREIINMTMNLGLSELRDKQGNKFLEEITNEPITYKRELLNHLNKLDEDKILDISTKVDVMNLSSGEKQIYILCLYWALIKSSNVSIPFIIDTPYARIDENHRKAITTEFLPGISQQVIVLSTNTEIDEELYKEINKLVSKEFTLDYDNNSRSTEVKSGYFYEVM